MEGPSASGSASTVSDDDNLVVSYEDSSCPVETEIDLGLALSLRPNGQRHSGVSCSEDCSSASSSLSRASATAGVKRAADSMAATNGQVVGWPPIRSYRMNSMVNQAKTLATGELSPENRENVSKNRAIVRTDSKIRNSMFVKVTMDGIPIGRKVDLNAHRSYKSLSKTLEEMFLRPSAGSNARENDAHTGNLLDGSSGFVLTYEDTEGDWMLVGDVPWGMFLFSVRKLRIMRTSEATGTTQMIS
ncbi:PREDICTED: auxin-responsive protein IAA11-like isoform X2 [Tarenaya hassleriana]|uniref:auxin-responsive protein IAA11-like isoform X2 n=1 Tax=Tarenaya hassleriana TaxID=28532 RepID=UPI00053C1D93|nr:PREDICTED: auxin-responsive protein IAA11-like isoform X2 [Tarenaya hassleriana]